MDSRASVCRRSRLCFSSSARRRSFSISSCLRTMRSRSSTARASCSSIPTMVLSCSCCSACSRAIAVSACAAVASREAISSPSRRTSSCATPIRATSSLISRLIARIPRVSCLPPPRTTSGPRNRSPASVATGRALIRAAATACSNDSATHADPMARSMADAYGPLIRTTVDTGTKAVSAGAAPVGTDLLPSMTRNPHRPAPCSRTKRNPAAACS